MMIPRKISRRRALRGTIGGGAIAVGLPLLDCFLNANGTALADGSPLPVCFGTWFWSCGFNPGRWEPATIGSKYDMAEELKALQPFRDKINIYSGLKAYLDGRPNVVHTTAPQVMTMGEIPRGQNPPSIDTLIADAIGTKTRFRSLEVGCAGSPASYSQRGGTVINPSETSPAGLYSRIFGEDFQDPNSDKFVPDPTTMARRSVLSGVAETRRRFMSDLGAADRARLEEYFTSIRQLENKLELELQKPTPLAACSVPGKVDDKPVGMVIDDVLSNNRLFAQLLAHALACGQTRVINSVFSPAFSPLRKAGSSMTFHLYTHEESLDPKLGYQPEATSFMFQCAQGFSDFVAAFDEIREGSGTLLDRTVILAHTDVSHARYHTIDNMPLLTAGGAAGRLKTGLHIQSKGDAVTRLGLTLQQAVGVPINSWGSDSNQTSKTITEVLA